GPDIPQTNNFNCPAGEGPGHRARGPGPSGVPGRRVPTARTPREPAEEYGGRPGPPPASAAARRPAARSPADACPAARTAGH
ncbi:hypothetical protein ACFV4M_14575, partial [Kitasatospora indigofera]